MQRHWLEYTDGLDLFLLNKKKYDLAKASFLYSSKIEKNDSIIDELRYIMSVSGDKNLDVDIKSLLKRDNIPALTVINIYDQLEQDQVDHNNAKYTLAQKSEGKSKQIVEEKDTTQQKELSKRDSKTETENAVTDGTFVTKYVREEPSQSNSATLRTPPITVNA